MSSLSKPSNTRSIARLPRLSVTNYPNPSHSAVPSTPSSMSNVNFELPRNAQKQSSESLLREIRSAARALSSEKQQSYEKTLYDMKQTLFSLYGNTCPMRPLNKYTNEQLKLWSKYYCSSTINMKSKKRVYRKRVSKRNSKLEEQNIESTTIPAVSIESDPHNEVKEHHANEIITRKLKSFQFYQKCSNYQFTIGKNKIERIETTTNPQDSSSDSITYNVGNENRDKLVSIDCIEQQQSQNLCDYTNDMLSFFHVYCSMFFVSYYVGIVNGVIVCIAPYAEVMEAINDLPDNVLLNSDCIRCRPIHHNETVRLEQLSLSESTLLFDLSGVSQSTAIQINEFGEPIRNKFERTKDNLAIIESVVDPQKIEQLQRSYYVPNLPLSRSWILLPVSCNNKRNFLWFLIDTGSPKTYFNFYQLKEYFQFDPNTLTYAEVRTSFLSPVLAIDLSLSLNILPNTNQDVVDKNPILNYINLLGGDLIRSCRLTVFHKGNHVSMDKPKL